MRTLLFILLCALIICLQMWLSKRENKWPGLMLPLLTFLFSLLFPLNMLGTGDMAADILHTLLIWLIANIPTFILLIIYRSCRNKQQKNKQLEKMKILDLD